MSVDSRGSELSMLTVAGAVLSNIPKRRLGNGQRTDSPFLLLCFVLFLPDSSGLR